jgi:hypothetical protein
MNRNIGILFLVLVAVAASVVIAETYPSNYVSKDDVVTLSWSVTSPTPGLAVIKSTSKATGAIIGVSLDGTGTAGENVQVVTRGIVSLAMTASSTVGNVCVGDYIYASVPATTTYLTTLSNINSGVIFAQALESYTASTTAGGVAQTIKMKLLQPSHL